MQNSNESPAKSDSELPSEIQYFQELRQLEEFRDIHSPLIELSSIAITLIAKISDKKAIYSLLKNLGKTDIRISTRSGRKLLIRIDQETFSNFGVNIFSQVTTFDGTQYTVIGYCPLEKQLIFYRDGDRGASFWEEVTSKATLNEILQPLEQPVTTIIPPHLCKYSDEYSHRFTEKLKTAIRNNEPEKITTLFRCLNQMQLTPEKMQTVIVLSESFINYLTQDIDNTKYAAIIQILDVPSLFYTNWHVSLFHTYLATLVKDQQDEAIQSLHEIVIRRELPDHLKVEALGHPLVANSRVLLAFIKLGLVADNICDIPRFHDYFCGLNADDSENSHFYLARSMLTDPEITLELLRITIESAVQYRITVSPLKLRATIVELKNICGIIPKDICRNTDNEQHEKKRNMFLEAIVALPGIDYDTKNSNNLFSDNQEKIAFIKKQFSDLFPSALTMLQEKGPIPLTDESVINNQTTPSSSKMEIDLPTSKTINNNSLATQNTDELMIELDILIYDLKDFSKVNELLSATSSEKILITIEFLISCLSTHDLPKVRATILNKLISLANQETSKTT